MFPKGFLYRVLRVVKSYASKENNAVKHVAISSISTMFFTLSEANLIIYLIHNLLFGNVFSFDKFKNSVILQSRLLTTLWKKPFENIVGKEKMLITSIFSFSHNVFYSIIERNHHFSNI